MALIDNGSRILTLSEKMAAIRKRMNNTVPLPSPTPAPVTPALQALPQKSEAVQAIIDEMLDEEAAKSPEEKAREISVASTPVTFEKLPRLKGD